MWGLPIMTTASVSNVTPAASSADGLRPVNLRTDLAPLADLLELVFADSMDSSGRAALREMRMMSKIGVGLNLLANVNEMAFGISMGYVYVVDGHVVGNASIYPARQPRGLGDAWIVANVGVHPSYQRRGIATQLVEACQAMIVKRGGVAAVLQVDVRNTSAQRIYERLGFRSERAWNHWRRTGSNRLAINAETNKLIAYRRNSEWREEFQLAQRIRPAEHGGLGWQQPLHPSIFRRGIRQRFSDWMNMRHLERFVIHADSGEIGGSLWVSNLLGYSSVDLTLMVDEPYQGIFDAELLRYAVRRYGRSTLRLDHPMDQTLTNAVLTEQNFKIQRSLMHMRWDIPDR